MKNNLAFAIRCPFEILAEHRGETTYRFDTRLLGGDYTLITIPTIFDSEQTARLKLFEEICAWDK